MSDKKEVSKAGLIIPVLIGVFGQVATSYAAYEFNETAGLVVAGMHVLIDVGLFAILDLRGHPMASDRDKGALLAAAVAVGIFAVATIVQALYTADDQLRNKKNNELAEMTKALASSAIAQSQGAASDSQVRSKASQDNPMRQSQYINQSIALNNNAIESRNQASDLIDKAAKLSTGKTRREKGLANLNGWLMWCYLIYAAVLVILIPTVLWNYGRLFGRRIDNQNSPKKQNSNETKKERKPTGTEPEKKKSVKTDSKKTKTSVKRNAPDLKLVKSKTQNLKFELSRKWVLSTSQKVNVANLMSHMKNKKEGVSNAKAREYLRMMCGGDEPILMRTSSAANAGFVRVRQEARVV